MGMDLGEHLALSAEKIEAWQKAREVLLGLRLVLGVSDSHPSVTVVICTLIQ